MFTDKLFLLPATFLFGITVGSFLNVCIYRLPKGEDVVHTDSHCMNCGYRLSWYDMIPILSWLCLRGRCRRCGARISVQYPLIECLNGLLWTGFIALNGLNAQSVCYCIAASSLLVLSVIDWRTYEIPLGCNLVILAAGAVNLVCDLGNWPDYLIGFLLVSGILLAILLASRGRAMGGGDVKLMAAAGLLLGWEKILLAFGLGCILGSVIHLTLMRVKGKERLLAFGPYLSLGIWIAMMWGGDLLRWYLGQFSL